MRYKNTKTGFVFDSTCELKGKDWVEMPSPSPKVKEEKEERPVRNKKEKKNEELRNNG